METLLEQQRRYHEERERLMEAMVKETLHSKKTTRETMNSDHRMRILLDRYHEGTAELRDLYEDKDGLRKEEIKSLSGPNEFAEFYRRLKDIREFYRRHPGEVSVPMSVEFEELAKARENVKDEQQVMAEFSDEEGYGKYLDLHECYTRFINLKGQEKIDYLSYLSSFDRLYELPRERKNAAYKDYLLLVLSYLEGYLIRVKPLLDMTEEMSAVQEEFERHWTEGTFPGWPKEASSALAQTGAHLDLSAFSSAEELASLGLDRLKLALIALGLKCGGTLEQRAERLFKTKGVRLNKLDTALFAKSKPGSKKVKERELDRHKETALLEAQLYRLVELLSEQRLATRENVLRKQSQSGGERDDSDGEHKSDDSSDEEGDDVPYNPKNLPLGWDGKPIPYWLYKLHGLNLHYPCEICGNYVYRGPKTFQRHFAERRHAYGMKCLGIPNTAHFANVVNIEDALALWEKIKKNKEFERWKPDADEEFEDSMGNVVNQKTFQDLARQDLL